MAQLTDGEYLINVTLSGGSGKANITSPCHLFVTDGNMQALIEWSSSNYDRMEVGEIEYTPLNESGNSYFLINVTELDADIPIKAETLAMSQPHMIDYTLRFDSSTVQEFSQSESIQLEHAAPQTQSGAGFSGAVCGTVAGILFIMAAIAVVLGKRSNNVKK